MEKKKLYLLALLPLTLWLVIGQIAFWSYIFTKNYYWLFNLDSDRFWGAFLMILLFSTPFIFLYTKMINY